MAKKAKAAQVETEEQDESPGKRPVEREITFPPMTDEEAKLEAEMPAALATTSRVMGEEPPIIWLHAVKKNKDGTVEEDIFASDDKKMSDEGRFFAIAQGKPGFTVNRISYWLAGEMMDSYRIHPIKLTEKDDKLFCSFESKPSGIMKHGRHIIHGSGKILFNICLKAQIEEERAKAKRAGS